MFNQRTVVSLPPGLRVCLLAALSAILLLGLPARPTQSAANTWQPTGSMSVARSAPKIALLPDGRVLVTGNTGDAEVYDPARGIWSGIANMGGARSGHTLTLLSDGRVLAAGGYLGSALNSAEIYDPVTDTWSATGNLNMARYGHTATLLSDGRVLVVGSSAGNNRTAEIYDPTQGTWSVTGSTSYGRNNHTATLLSDGRVLVVSGYMGNFVEVYNPTLGTWSNAAGLNTRRFSHSATRLPDGRVLVAGGVMLDNSGLFITVKSTEIYDPALNTWTVTGEMSTARAYHTATLLPNGRVLVAGGKVADIPPIAPWVTQGEYDPFNSVEIYNPATGTWSTTATLDTARASHGAALLPSGQVLVVGGIGLVGGLSSAEVYNSAQGTWTTTGSMNTDRAYHSATLLLDGRVLVVGGERVSTTINPLSSAEVYNPAQGTWSVTGNMNTAHAGHTATLLPDGRVLVVGGWNVASNYNLAEVYDPALGTWSVTGNLNTGRRYGHTATLLPDGRVLAVGGYTSGQSNTYAGAEIYASATGTWRDTGSPTGRRSMHSATLLSDGRVLIAGGEGSDHSIRASAEIYNPALGTWTTTGNLNVARSKHNATLLADGRVLITGGNYLGIDSAEIYNPADGVWSLTESLNMGRRAHSATLLANGQVLVAGGINANNTAEIYDPGLGTWSVMGNLNTGRETHRAILLPNGQVLVAGGIGSDHLNSAEVYDPGLGFLPAWRPTLNPLPTSLTLGETITATGSGWRGYGYADTAGGNSTTAATNFPLVRLYRLDNAQTLWLPTQAFNATGLTTVPLRDIAPGPALVWVFVNGIPSAAQEVVITRSTQYVYLPLVTNCYPRVPSLELQQPHGDGLYTLQWTVPTCGTPPDNYQVQVATNAQFNNPQNTSTTHTTLNVYTPEPATYYWRVRASSGGQWTGWSNVRSVTVGAFSYLFVKNDTGGNLTLEVVNVQTHTFPSGFDAYWRSVPIGTYTVKATARCGSRTDNYTLPLGAYTLEYFCGKQAFTGALEASTDRLPDAPLNFDGFAPDTMPLYTPNLQIELTPR